METNKTKITMKGEMAKQLSLGRNLAVDNEDIKYLVDKEIAVMNKKRIKDKYNNYQQKVKDMMIQYKKIELGINDIGSDELYMPKNMAKHNILIDIEEYTLTKDILSFTNKKGQPSVKLNSKWTRLDSSQVLTINYFYKYLDEKDLQNALLKFLNINEKASNAKFEEDEDSTHVNFVINLENKKRVYIVTRYCEEKLQSADGENLDYEGKEGVKVKKEDYTKFSKIASNAENGNYLVIIYPMKNRKLQWNIDNSKIILRNILEIDWNDLLEELPNDNVFEKYFWFE